jgi:SOS response regulatory protein OraA/RecX
LSFEAAYARALQKIRRKDCFAAEIVEALPEYSAEDVSRVLGRLCSQGILNDERLVAKLVAANFGKAAVGREVLAESLRARGAPDFPLSFELEKLPNEVERALGLALTRPPAGRMTLRRYLVSKGFEPEVADEALDRLTSASE